MLLNKKSASKFSIHAEEQDLVTAWHTLPFESDSMRKVVYSESPRAEDQKAFRKSVYIDTKPPKDMKS